MKFRLYDCVHEFHCATFDLMMENEAQNIIPLGNIIMGKAGKDRTGWRDPANWLMATVSDGGGVVLAALQTPPHNLTLCARGNSPNAEAIDTLIRGLEKYPLSGVISEKKMAEFFAEKYCAATKMKFETKMNQRIYELSRVNPGVPQIGTLRLAAERDMYFLPHWNDAFLVEGGLEHHITTPLYAPALLPAIENNNFFVLEESGAPVSMAKITREMQTVCAIAGVYTPPFFRGKGYASSCVAKVSQIALNRGFERCVLYTDLANPTSNSIYQKIGYAPVCDSVMLMFQNPIAS